LALSSAAAQAATAAPLYRISEVPAVAGTMPMPVAINDLGVVVGTLYPQTGNRRVFRWREGRPLELAPLGNPKYEQDAVSVDHLGAVSYAVGWPGNIFPGKHLRTEVWGRGTQVAKKLPGLYSFFGNAAGDLVISGDRRAYALRERDGTLTEIEAPPKADVFDLNNRQQVVGTSAGRPVWWSPDSGLKVIPALEDEPLVAAKAVNDKGDVALMTGPFELARDDPDNAPNAVYVWNSATGVQPIGALPDCAWYHPYRMANQGTVVGDCYAEPSPLSEQHAFAWSAGSGIYLLDSQIDPADPLVGQYRMRRAVGVNGSGQILVEAVHQAQGRQRVLVLTPLR
jgi:hypothetical protein